jgi:hypothetical protein
MDAERYEDEPPERLTRLCATAMQAMEGSPEYREDDKMIIFLDDEQSGGLVLHGYDNDTDAVAAIMGHLKAIFNANGFNLEIVTMGEENDRPR